jgi:hypothetical protein
MIASAKSHSPEFLSLLSPADQLQYAELSVRLSSRSNRYVRHHRLDQFKSAESAIRAFCLRSDDDDWKRCLVCGLWWFPSGLCINTAQLKLLLGKSKSSINGALSQLGFESVPVSYAQDGELLRVMPFMRDRPAAARQWTMRRAPERKRADAPKTAESDTESKEEPQKQCSYVQFWGCDCRAPGDTSAIPCLCDLGGAMAADDECFCHCASALGMEE